MLKRLALFLALVLSVSAADDSQPSCQAHDCNTGYKFDLNGLSASEGDYKVTTTSGRNITLNVCRSVVSDLWNPKVDRPQDVGAFYRGAHGDMSIGKVNRTLEVSGGNPVLLMTDGSACPQSDSIKASTAIRFICDYKAEEEKPILVAQLPPSDDDACAFFIEWKTKHACPVPDRYAYWKTAVMVIVIFLAIVVTLGALFALLRLLKARRANEGYDPAPSYSSREGLFASIGDRLRDVKRHLTGQDPWGHPTDPLHPASAQGTANGGSGGGKSWRPSFKFGRRGTRGRNGGFSRLSQNPEEEAMMGNGGPFSVDDDDEEDERREVNGNAESFAEESAAWGATRPRPGLDGNGVIRL